jgi:hypothetical protein
VEEEKQQSELDAFRGEAIGITLAVALEQSVALELAKIITQLRTCICNGSTLCFMACKGRGEGPMSSWYVTPTILWRWRNRWDRRPLSSSSRGWKERFQLEINREKTRVVDLREEGASLNFLGCTFRYDRDLKGRGRKYLNVFPSSKAVQREREKLYEMTQSRQCFKPIPILIGELNRQLKGWMNYFSFGYPSSAYCEIERYVRDRLIQHLQRRSQRSYRPPQGEPWLQHLARLELIRLSGVAHA